MASLPLQDLFGVKGYVAVVTGGSSGLGFMICKVASKSHSSNEAIADILPL